MFGRGKERNEEKDEEKMKKLLEAASYAEVIGINKKSDVKSNTSSGSSNKLEATRLEKEGPIPPTPEVDYDQLCDLLKGTTISDYKILDKTAAAVKQFLLETVSNPAAYERLLKIKEYVPFVVKCLKAKSTYPSLQANAAFMFGMFISKRNKAQIREACGKGAVSSLLKLLDHSLETSVLESVTRAISFAAKDSYLRPQLLPACTSNNIFNELIKIINKKDPSPSEMLLEFVSNVITFMLTIGNQARIDDAEHDGMHIIEGVETPSHSLVKAALPIISVIMNLDTKNDVILVNMLQCMCLCGAALDNMKPFLETKGLSNKLVSYLKLDLESKELLRATAIALGNIFARSDLTVVMKFLNTLEDTDGLRNYWKCIKLNEKDRNEHLYMASLNFVDTIGKLILRDRLHVAAETIIKCGAAHALANFLHNDCPSEFSEHAICILGVMSSDLLDGRKPVFIEMGLLPHAVKLLKKWIKVIKNAAIRAFSIISMLVESSIERRDEALSLGLVPILLDIIGQNPITEVKITYNALEVLLNLIREKPKTSMAPFKDVPEALRNFFSVPIDATNVTDYYNPTVLAILCIGEIIGYGQEGIDLMLTPPLAVKMISHLWAWEKELQEIGMGFILRHCESGNAQHRRILLDLGVLEHFKDLLLSPMINTRKMLLECMLIILDDELKPIEKTMIDGLKRLVLAEVKKNISDTEKLARAVYIKIIT